jgi:hypothetical protein
MQNAGYLPEVYRKPLLSVRVGKQEEVWGFGVLIAKRICIQERPLRAPGRLLQGSFLEVSLALVGVLYPPGLIPILEDLAEECNQKLYFFIRL